MQCGSIMRGQNCQKNLVLKFSIVLHRDSIMQGCKTSKKRLASCFLLLCLCILGKPLSKIRGHLGMAIAWGHSDTPGRTIRVFEGEIDEWVYYYDFLRNKNGKHCFDSSLIQSDVIWFEVLFYANWGTTASYYLVAAPCCLVMSMFWVTVRSTLFKHEYLCRRISIILKWFHQHDQWYENNYMRQIDDKDHNKFDKQDHQDHWNEKILFETQWQGSQITRITSWLM